MTLEIKINLANPPKEAPWNFPHQCFSIAFRIKAALDVVDGVEPWGKDEATSPARFLAYRQLYELNELAFSLFNTADRSPSPFDAALEVIDVKYKREGHELLWWKSNIDGARGGFHDSSHDWSTLTQGDLPKLNEEYLPLAQRLENVGVYFLRMMQAASGRNLPDEHVVKAEKRSAGWTPIFDAGDE